MTSKKYHLAQANIARMRGSLHDPVMEGFRLQLDAINAAADRSSGFVWRLQSDAGDATGIRAFEDERIIINMSVWNSLEELHQYVYRSEHLGPLRNRKEWFEPLEPPSLVLWWIPAGHVPTVEEAKDRLQYLKLHGPTAEAFTFRSPFSAPEQRPIAPPEVEAEFCGAAGR